MSSRKRSKKGSNKSYTYNFLLPLYDNTSSSLKQPLYYGPLLYDRLTNPPYDPTKFEMTIPIKESDTIQGTRTVTNLQIELMTCFLQPNDDTGKYERIYPLGVQLVTAILRQGQTPSMVLNEIYDSKHSRQYRPTQSATKTFEIGEIVGRSYNPDQYVLDIRPLLMSNAGGNNPTCTQIVNRVSVPGPVHLDEGDLIVIFFTVPGDLTLFYEENSDIIPNQYFVAVNGTVTYSVNF